MEASTPRASARVSGVETRTTGLGVINGSEVSNGQLIPPEVSHTEVLVPIALAGSRRGSSATSVHAKFAEMQLPRTRVKEGSKPYPYERRRYKELLGKNRHMKQRAVVRHNVEAVHHG